MPLFLAFSPRFITLTLAVLASLAFLLGLIALPQSPILIAGSIIAVALVALGVRDLLQTRHAVLRNYPIAAHLRFLLEQIRPEMRQYFFEDDKNGMPFSRDKRAVIYQRAKMQLDKRPFGTVYDVYADGYEWMNHSLAPKNAAAESFRIVVGGPECERPYSASVFNISAMSFGSLSPNAIRALNKGAQMGGFAHDTGEGGVSSYHHEWGGDIIWEIGSGYFGARDINGRFSPELFAETARHEQIKMIELKLSQGAKPGHGGVLPAAKVTAEIARIRGVPQGQDCVSPSRHSAFSTPIEMMRFLADMRRLSGGKPTGFKLCVGHDWEFLAICKAMLETGLYPDFIVIDGKEGGTGAAPLEFMDHIGKPMREGLTFVHNALVGIGARDRIRLAASGKIATAFDIARALALGGRLVQLGARLHVRARLSSIAILPHRPLSHRRGHPGPDSPAGPLRPGQGPTGRQFSPLDDAVPRRDHRGGRAEPSQSIRAAPHLAARVAERGADIRRALPGTHTGRVADGHRRPALPQGLGDGQRGYIPSGLTSLSATGAGITGTPSIPNHHPPSLSPHSRSAVTISILVIRVDESRD